MWSRILAAAALAAVACSSDSTGGGDVLVVATVVVTPPGATLTVGQSQAFSAEPRTSSGVPVPNRPVTWLSNNQTVASVSPNGVVTANVVGGPVTITARVDDVDGTVQVTVAPRPATQLAFVAGPADGLAGRTLPPVQVAVQDAVGGTVTGATTAVTLALEANPGSTTLGGTLTRNAVNGIATFSDLVIPDAADGYTLRATAAALLPAVSGPFDVAPPEATTLAMFTQPSAVVTNGEPFPQQPVVQLMDATNTPIAQAGVIVSAALHSGSPALSGTTTATTDANGRATFTNLTLTGPVGDRILIFAAPDFVSVVSNTITVVAGSATALQIVTQPPSTAQSGVLLDPPPAVRVVDQSGNPVADGGRQITAALVGGGTLDGTATMATEPDGVATFTDLALSGTVSPPNRTLSFTSAGLTGVSSAPITLLTGPAARLTLTTQPATTATSGEALNPQPQVQLRDSGDNPVAQAGVVITAVIATSPGGTPALTNPQATTNASGLATFSGLTLTGPAGAYTLRFETGALTPVTSGTVTLGAGDETQLSITTPPSSSAQSGVALATQPAIQLRDAGGNPVASAGHTVTAVFATSPGGTPTLENGTATTDATGLATFSGLAISGLIGDYTLRFESGALTPATSGTISLSEGPVATLVFFTAPSTTAQSGVELATQPVVRTLDSGGNNLNSVVVAASVSPGGSLLGTVTATSGPPQARAAFTNLAISGLVGSYALTFTAGSATPLVSSPIALSAGPAAQMGAASVITQSAPAGTAVDEPPAVLVTDGAGNPVGGFGVTFTVIAGDGTTSPTSGSLVATNASGVATLTSWTLGPDVGVENNRVDATAALTGSPVIFLASGAAGEPTQLVITTQPSANATNDVAFAQQPAVQARDAIGNPVSGVSVTASLQGGGTLLGTSLTVVSNGSGNAVFSGLEIVGSAGTKQLVFSAAGLPDATSQDIELAAGAATQLVITTQPGGTTAEDGSPLVPQPVLEFRDSGGNVANVTDAVTASLTPDSDEDLTVTGGDTVNAVSGVVTFVNLTLGGTGLATLRFTSGGLTADSAPFTVVSP